jgi:hypothetical protein
MVANGGSQWIPQELGVADAQGAVIFGVAGSDRTPCAARLRIPTQIRFDAAGNLYAGAGGFGITGDAAFGATIRQRAGPRLRRMRRPGAGREAQPAAGHAGGWRE